MRALWLMVTLCGMARAADPADEANRLLVEAKKLSDSGKIAEAIERFRAAEAIYPRGIHDCNLGLAYARLNKPAQSLLYLESCSARTSGRLPDWVAPRIARTRAELSRAGYAPLELSSQPAGARATVSSLGRDCPFVLPRRVWVPLGQLDVEASLTGFLDEQRHLDVGGPAEVRLELRAPPPLPAPVAVEPPRVEPPKAEPPKVEAPKPPLVTAKPRDSKRQKRLAASILLSMGAGILIAAMATNLAASLVTRPDAEMLPPGPEFQSQLNIFHQERDAAIAGYVVGGALALAGVGTLISMRF